jgi:cytochrome oxidase Cu insertion factor (SCO1/SenC/PrrC family)
MTKPLTTTTRKIVWALAASALAVFLFAAIWIWGPRQAPKGSSKERPLEGLGLFGSVPNFNLTERSGRSIALKDLKGKVWIVNFIYTHCPDTCPVQSVQMKELQSEFADEKDLRLISITVDPRRDTPRVLSAYADRFGADPERWWFLTGDRDAIYKLAIDGFRLGAAEIPQEKRPASGATHAHSPRFVLVDRNARIRGYYASTEPEAMGLLRRDLKTLLRG